MAASLAQGAPASRSTGSICGMVGTGSEVPQIAGASQALLAVVANASEGIGGPVQMKVM